jgi:hypothetical protein
MEYTTRSKVSTGRRDSKGKPVKVTATRMPTMAVALSAAARQHVRTHGMLMPGTPHIIGTAILAGLCDQKDLVIPV